MTFITIAVIVLLVLINALYVAAEFATVGSRRTRIRQLAGDGNGLAKRLLPIMEDTHRLDRYIAACQIGITISSLVLGAYGQATLVPAFVPLFESWGGMQQAAAQSTSALIILIGLTAFQMIFGELVPKSIALQFPNRTALFTVIPMQWSLVFLSWFIKVLNGSGILVLKLFGVQAAGHVHIHSPEEIEMLIAESRDGGLLEADEHNRLRKALKLNLRTVEQVMVPRTSIKMLDANQSVDEILRKVVESPYTRLPVYRDSTDNVVGILHTKDLALAHSDAAPLTSLDAVLRQSVFIPEGVTVDRALKIMRERRSHQTLIVDEHGGISGLVTLEDILAEVFGDTSDEFKTINGQVERLPDGRVRLAGSLRLDEASELLGVNLISEADTLGGFVMQFLGHVPQAGERVSTNGVELEVEEVKNRVVQTLIAEPAVPQKKWRPGEGE